LANPHSVQYTIAEPFIAATFSSSDSIVSPPLGDSVRASRY
jgi:hypothetical protein